MYSTLQEIKEQLFDAPVEVKEAFNNVVGYFSYKNPLDKYFKGGRKTIEVTKEQLRQICVDWVGSLASVGPKSRSSKK